MPTHPGRKAPRIAAATLVAAACSILVSSAQQPSGTLPLVPAPASGGGVTPPFQAWYQNGDGSYSFLVGYYNRNTREAIDIPIGPNNKVEPGLPDQGQPTHFET